MLTGSADLFGSTKNYLKDGGDFSKADPLGRNIWFGIREHAMGAVMNGMSLSKVRPYGSGFLIFSDYGRAPIRLADARRLAGRYWFVVALGAVLTLARFSEAFLVLRAAEISGAGRG